MSPSPQLAEPGSSSYSSGIYHVGDGTWDSSKDTFLLPNLQSLPLRVTQYNGMIAHTSHAWNARADVFRHGKPLQSIRAIPCSHHGPWSSCRNHLPRRGSGSNHDCTILPTQPSARSSITHLAADLDIVPDNNHLRPRVVCCRT
jgi:hypothetical protein